MDENDGIGHCREQVDLGCILAVAEFCSGPSSGPTKEDGPYTGTKISIWISYDILLVRILLYFFSLKIL